MCRIVAQTAVKSVTPVSSAPLKVVSLGLGRQMQCGNEGAAYRTEQSTEAKCTECVRVYRMCDANGDGA